MEFFDREARARRQTRWLLGLFGLSPLAFIFVTYLLLILVVHSIQHPALRGHPWDPISLIVTLVYHFGEALVRPFHFLARTWNPQLAGWIALGTVLSMAIACFFQFRMLAAGGPAVARLLGGRRVDPDTADFAEKRLLNVVEEMAIASSMPVPDVYVLNHERGVNAFAAGYRRDDVAIGITYGALKLLNRDELQGIVGHEFSHILNGDTRLNMILIGLAHGLLWPTIVGRVLLRGTGKPPEIGESILDERVARVSTLLAPLAFLFLLIGCLGTPFMRLVKSQICREREWLADAEAVQFTRHPSGIEGALKKVGGLLKQGRLDTPHAETASHLYFANSRHESWLKFFSTHPPLKKRIQTLDPAFDGQFERIHSVPSRAGEYDRLYEENIRRAQAEARANPETWTNT